MKYAIIYSTVTGNTEQLAKFIYKAIGKNIAIYKTPVDMANINADLYFIGFWVDRGVCDNQTASVLNGLKGKKIFLFGTAGIVNSKSILNKTSKHIDSSNTVVDSFICKGKISQSFKQKYIDMLNSKLLYFFGKFMLKNFELSQTHPNTDDFNKLNNKIKNIDKTF